MKRLIIGILFIVFLLTVGCENSNADMSILEEESSDTANVEREQAIEHRPSEVEIEEESSDTANVEREQTIEHRPSEVEIASENSNSNTNIIEKKYRLSNFNGPYKYEILDILYSFEYGILEFDGPEKFTEFDMSLFYMTLQANESLLNEGRGIRNHKELMAELSNKNNAFIDHFIVRYDDYIHMGQQVYGENFYVPFESLDGAVLYNQEKYVVAVAFGGPYPNFYDIVDVFDDGTVITATFYKFLGSYDGYVTGKLKESELEDCHIGDFELDSKGIYLQNLENLILCVPQESISLSSATFTVSKSGEILLTSFHY